MILTSNSTKSRRHGKLVNLELVAQTIKRLRDQIYFVCVVNLDEPGNEGDVAFCAASRAAASGAASG